MKRKKNFCRVLTMVVTMILLSAFIIVGCTNQTPDDMTPTPDNPTDTTPGDATIEGTFDQERVSALESAIEEMPEVENAYAVLSSDSAWIALDLVTDGIMDNNNGLGTTPGTMTPDATTPGTTPNTTPDVTPDTTGTTPGTTTGGTTPDLVPGNDDQMMVPEALRTTIESTTKSMYPEITNVFVTAETDYVDRIQQIGRDLATGKPIKEFANDLREIGDAIIPG